MKEVFKPWEWIVLVVSIVFIIVFVNLVDFVKKPLITGIVLCSVAVVFFGLTLDMRTTRIRKGICIIGVGVITAMIYNLAIKAQVMCALALSYNSKECDLGFSGANGFIAANTIDNMILLISLACAGAGGSIIAAHGDRNSTDTHPLQPSAATDIKPLIESVIRKLDRQNGKINLIGISVAVAVPAIAIVAFFRG